MIKVVVIELLLIGGLFLTPFNSLQASKEIALEQQLVSPSVIHSKVSETIQYSQDVPGLNSGEFSTLKAEILKMWDILQEEGSLEVEGTDEEVRPYFVALQGIIEHVLASELQNGVTSLKGFILNPMPPTSLSKAGSISKDLAGSSIESDPKGHFTVKERATILRDFLFKGGDLYILYPKNGLEKRTKQKNTYHQDLANYPSHLFDVPLNTESISVDLIGSTYLFQDHSGKTFVFAIKMPQAKDPKNSGSFGLWLGSLDHPSIQARAETISSYMEENGSNELKMVLLDALLTSLENQIVRLESFKPKTPQEAETALEAANALGNQFSCISQKSYNKMSLGQLYFGTRIIRLMEVFYDQTTSGVKHKEALDFYKKYNK